MRIDIADLVRSYAGAFLDYYHRDLNFGAGKTYQTTNYAIGEKWKWSPVPASAVPMAVVMPEELPM